MMKDAPAVEPRDDRVRGRVALRGVHDVVQVLAARDVEAARRGGVSKGGARRKARGGKGGATRASSLAAVHVRERRAEAGQVRHLVLGDGGRRHRQRACAGRRRGEYISSAGNEHFVQPGCRLARQSIR